MKKGLIISISIVLLLAILVFANLNVHLVRALIFGKPTISDVKHFDYDTVPNGVYTPWLLGKYHNIDIPPDHIPTIRRLQTTAFLVCTDSLLLSEHYWGGYDRDSVSNVFSLTKSIVSLLVGQAVEEGYISSINDKVVKYLPEFDHDGNSSITIKDLLTMRSGLDWNEYDKTLFSPIARLYFGKNVRRQVCDLRSVKAPGRDFEYQSCNTQILGLILEKTTRMPLSYYAASRLWVPLGARSYALWGKDDKGNTKSYCCFNTVARDVARVGQLILCGGKWKGLQLVPEKFITEATSDIVVRESTKPDEAYGYQFWITSHKGLRVIYGRGILGQYLIMIPAKKLIIVRFGKARDETKMYGNPKDLYSWIDVGLAIAQTGLER